MMKLPIYQVDAFASGLFQGNPAAVCPLESWLPVETMQAIALENNLSETAFYVPAGEEGRYRLRWFTPEVEIELCGHATVATASVIREIRRETPKSRLFFETLSGELFVDISDRYELDFPANPASEAVASDLMIAGLGARPESVLAARDYMCIFPSADDVRSLTPDFAKLAQLDRRGIIVTAPGIDEDFVSRFFAPSKGVNEDPVTGSAHTMLIPYWAKRLEKKKMFARQVSRRGGELWCEDCGHRVKIGGRAVHYLTGEISIPATSSPAGAS